MTRGIHALEAIVIAAALFVTVTFDPAVIVGSFQEAGGSLGKESGPAGRREHRPGSGGDFLGDVAREGGRAVAGIEHVAEEAARQARKIFGL